MAGMVIRQAAITDAEPIASLVTDLGYPASATQMYQRLQGILDDEDYHTLVACIGGQVVGFVGARLGVRYEDDGRYGQIMALAVVPSQRRRGVGRILMRAAEAIIGEHGARVLIVTSGNQRSDAHAFYEKCGYGFTGRRYKKSFAAFANRGGAADARPGGGESM